MIGTKEQRKAFRQACWLVFTGFPLGTPAQERKVTFELIKHELIKQRLTLPEDTLLALYQDYKESV